jgi:invasion protein IalB
MIALLGLGTALSAQEAPATEEEAPTDAAEAPAEDAVGDDGLDMGQEVQENPTYIKEEYGDWQLKCFRSEAEEDPCQMYQLLREEGGNPVAEISLFKLPQGSQAAAGATIIVPLGTLLPEGLKISVDGGRPKSYDFSFCTMAGCFARIGLTSAEVEQFKAGASAFMEIVPAQAPDQTVEIEASLDGFTAAYGNVSTVQN